MGTMIEFARPDGGGTKGYLAIAGTPAMVRDYIAREIEATGVNYYVCDFAFGTISHDEAMRSVELFTREVMPAFGDA